MPNIKNAIQEIVKNSEKAYSNKQVSCKAVSLLLYTDTKDYSIVDVLEKLKQLIQERECNYALMKHDRDLCNEPVFDDMGNLLYDIGEIKKEHYHIYVIFKNQTYINDIAIALGIDDKWIQVIKPKNIINALLYPSHIKYPNKYQYELKDYDTNIGGYIAYYYELEREKLINGNIVHYVNEYCKSSRDKKVSKSELFEKIEELGYDLKSYKDYYQICKDIIAEHNSHIEFTEYADVQYSKGFNDANKDMTKMFNLADNFGATTIDNFGKKYILAQDTRKGKNKK